VLRLAVLGQAFLEAFDVRTEDQRLRIANLIDRASDLVSDGQVLRLQVEKLDFHESGKVEARRGNVKAGARRCAVGATFDRRMCPICGASVHFAQGDRVIRAIPVKHLCRIVLATVMLFAGGGGCTAGWYERSADKQVHRILRDRKEQTLGYQPQTVAPTTVDPKPSKQAYAKIPQTPIPPPLPEVVERSEYERLWVPLGPQDFFGEDVSPQHELMTDESARAPAMQRLRLGPPATVPDEQVFDLFDAIDYAVENSRDYQTRMEDLYLAALDVTLERHLFSPRPFAQTGVQYSGGQRDVEYRSALAVTNSVGVRQQLPYGGEIVAQALVDFVDAIRGNATEGESAELVLSGTIPLLRGAGMVNLEPLIQSERALVYEVRDFEDFRRDFAVRVATQYIQLLSRQQAIANRRFNYVVLANLTEQTQALYAAGRINFLQVQRALQSQLSAENSLINAQDAYETSVDAFKVLLGMPVDQELAIIPVQLDVPIPDLSVDATELALLYRLDLQTARDQIEDAQRAVQVAKNGLLPDLDVTARGSIGNPQDTPASHIGSRTAEYSAAVTLDWPLDRLRERNIYRRALIALERAQRGFVTARELIISAVREDTRNIRSAQAQLQIQQRGIELAQRRLEYSNELLIQGRATDSRDVVEAQADLLEAQDEYESARAELQIQVLQFLRDTGTLRVDASAGALGIAMDRARPDPPPRPFPPVRLDP
jgi:hypothetical protein